MITDEMIEAGLSFYSEGGCMGLDDRERREVVTDIITAANAAAWRPIESAPRDGTRFWGKVDDDAIAMSWHPTFNAFVSSWQRMEMAAGFTIDGASFKDHSPTVHKPEAWMPLPGPPPQQEGE